METITIREMLEKCSSRYHGAVAFQMRRNGGYRKITFQQAAEAVKKIQFALMNFGVGKEDRVALISENRPEWGLAYLAITSMGAIVVPLDALLTKEDLSLLLDDCGAKAIILSDKYKDHIQGKGLNGKEIFMDDIAQLPAPVPFETPKPELDDTAAIVYTSGTTGVPKGVMLTHRNIMSNVITVSSLFDFSPSGTFLSVLPLHHTFETTAGFFGPFYNGSAITYTESLKSNAILRNMKETNVTVMCGVPLLYQLFYNGILREVEEKKSKPLFITLLSISQFIKSFIGVNIGKYLFGMIHKKFGGKIRFFVSGGAPIDPDLLKGFDRMGFTILQGYGLTESSPIITCCTLKGNKLGSVGRPIPGVEIKILGTDPVGEILATGPNIMKGYYKRKELTSRVLINGWLYTGDVGYIDEEGYVFITGRSKDVIVTAAGVNVYPEEIEFALKKNPAVSEAFITGSKVKEGLRKGSEEVVAVIVPDYEYLKKQGKTDDVEVHKEIQGAVFEFNRKAADFKRIARFSIRKMELPKTRLMKIKRFELKKELEF